LGYRALLVYPKIPPTYWSFRYSMPFLGKRASFPPLGLLTLAALLPEDFEITLVDMNVAPLSEEAVRGADLVLVSAMLVQKDSLATVVELCRRCGTPVVVGGPYPTSCRERIPDVDHFVLGEAEVTLPAFLEDFRRGEARPLYTAPDRADISTSPVPRFDLAPGTDYAAMAVQFSRGCPHDCEFCDVVELFGHTPRTKSPAQFLREMEALYATGWRGSVFVVDDNFIGNRGAVKALLREVGPWQAARGRPFTFFTEATLDLASDEELLDLMAEAGFNMVFLGIETPVQETLQAIGKRTNLKGGMLESVRRIQRHGMEVSAGFILGFDTDPTDIFERQVDFIEAAAIPVAMIGLLTALPGTRLYKRLEAEGRLAGEAVGNNAFELRLDFTPRMDPAVLLGGYRGVLARLYRPSRYFDRCLRLLRELKVHRGTVRRIGWPELRACLYSLLRQSFSGYAWSYWSYMSRALARRPHLAPEIIAMSVKGHHLFTMTDRVLQVERFKARVERTAREFQARVAALTAGDSARRMQELCAYRDKQLKKLTAKAHHIHRDFRRYAEEAQANLRARMEETLQRLQREPSPA